MKTISIKLTDETLTAIDTARGPQSRHAWLVNTIQAATSPPPAAAPTPPRTTRGTSSAHAKAGILPIQPLGKRKPR